jgi:hypothetical protein
LIRIFKKSTGLVQYRFNKPENELNLAKTEPKKPGQTETKSIENYKKKTLKTI